MAAGRDAAARDYRDTGAARDFDDLWHDRKRADLSGVSCGVIALGDDAVDARVDLGFCLTRLAHQAPNEHALFMGTLEDEVRVAEA